MQHQETVRALAAARKDEPGGLIPALHDIQDALGHIPSAAVPVIAEQFNLSRAEVHGVVSYYHHFRSAPAGRLLVQVCRAEACKSMGADALLDHAKERLGCDVHGTSADGRYSLEPVFCLGLCASSPAIAVNDEVHARVTPKLFDEIVDDAGSLA
jgi:formate dehydrogenase subunit gamma